jgi:hypothetical protein
VWNAYLSEYISDWYAAEWAETGQSGAYNDDIMNTVGENQYKVVDGGRLHEYANATVQSDEIVYTYSELFVSFLRAIATKAKKFVGGNVSGVNLFKSKANSLLITALDLLLQEDYYHAGLGLTGYFGIQKSWDTAVYAALGKRSVLQGMIENGASRYWDRSLEVNWQRDQKGLLAAYYLMSQGNATSFLCWGNGFWYGSINTLSHNYWKSGVPQNVAYQPTAMMQVDIGEPVQGTVEVRDCLLNSTVVVIQIWI